MKKFAISLILLFGFASTVQAAPISVSGNASWYCLTPVSRCTAGFAETGLYAAAGPKLRAAIGTNWRGYTVKVTAMGKSVVVKLIDFCACEDNKVIDLYAVAWETLYPNHLEVGLLSVLVSPLAPGSLPTTDTAPNYFGMTLLLILGAVVVIPMAGNLRKLWS